MEDRVIEQFKGFMTTPHLWKGPGPFGLEQFHLPPLPTLPQEKHMLKELPSLSRNYVLGKRMESFFSYVIRNSTDNKLIAENLQIAREKITIGEIDFIVQNEQEVLHVELVYKFYVYDPSFKNEEERWIGPNRRDNLLRKIKKLKESQFPLLFQDETKRALNSLGIEENGLKQQVCFKASLFIPFEMAGQSIPLINNNCICGYWIRMEKFLSQEHRQNMFFAPKKPDWPIAPEANKEWLTYPHIKVQVEEFHENKISPLLWMKTPGGEVKRLFVVWW